MIDLQVFNNTKEVFEKVKEIVGNSEKILDRTGDYVRKEIVINLDSEGRPKYPKSKSAIAENRITLEKSFALRKSFENKNDTNSINIVSKNQIIVGSKLPYANLMDKGGKIKAWGKTEVILPKREYTNLPNAEKDISKIVLKVYEEEMAK